MDSRWVIKFKLQVTDGKIIVKSRMCIRGFKDREAEGLWTYADTATLASQRLINTIAATKRWTLWSMDVRNAFLKGMTFQEASIGTLRPAEGCRRIAS